MPHRLIAILVALFAVEHAGAFVTMHDSEQHDGKAVPSGDGAWKHVAAVLNSPGREYWRDRGSTGFGSDYHAIVAAFRGDASDLNRLLRTLAELPAPIQAEVVLIPGAGSVLDQKGRRVSCDWRARLEYRQFYEFRNRPAPVPNETLTVRLEVFVPNVSERATPATAELLAAWIADLDSPRFAVRDKAQHNLDRHGSSAHAAVQKALADQPSAEKKRRLEQILKQLELLQLADVQAPRGLAVVSFDMLVERERKSLKSQEPGIRWAASQRLSDAIEGADELLPLLTSLIDDESLVALQRQVRDAPKDYLLALKPLLTAKSPSPERRAEQAAAYRELRQRLDRFCRQGTKPE